VGHVLRGGGAAASQELHEHPGLLRVAHALGDGLPQALVGGGGGWGHGWDLGRDLSQALRDASTPFPCVGCTNITELLK
jgi:hypothetical protein